MSLDSGDCASILYYSLCCSFSPCDLLIHAPLQFDVFMVPLSSCCPASVARLCNLCFIAFLIVLLKNLPCFCLSVALKII